MIDARQLTIPWDASHDPSQLRRREWLVTNGLGGYSSNSVAGVPSRKYHGLFVPNLTSPKGRHILISRCDELLMAGERQLHLGGAEFSGDRLVSESHRYLREFRLNRRIATWRFDFEDGISLEKAITMPHNHNTVCVRYRLLQGANLQLQIRPFMAFRRHDEQPSSTLNTDFTLSVARGRHEVRHAHSPIVLRMAMQPTPARFMTDERDELEFFYRIDFDRGDPHLESAFSPGYFAVELTPGQPATFVASTHEWESLQFDAADMFDAEIKRTDTLLARCPDTEKDAFASQLALAADQFIVMPGSRLEESVIAQAEGSDLRTVIAGYHWFGDWGRDTMISFEGLTLCTGRYREAGAILRTFSHYVKDGLLPNLFPEGARQALYHTVDATLWYFHAIARYVAVTKDRSIVEQLYPVLSSIVDCHLRGTHYGIHVDKADGLITAGAEGYQLTWMDAKVDGWVVTPRRGKPVEIQALWYNALTLMAQWSADLKRPAGLYKEQAELAKQSFNKRYWNEANGCLFDVLDGPDGNDPAIRPNQIFSISLPHPILEEGRWAGVVDVVNRKLVTPYGLRTLSPDHPDFKAHYRGNLRERDAAYHQGTVWPWLLGHFVDASLKVQRDPAYARNLLRAFEGHLEEAGVGSISEIFDATEPYSPGGCVAQAWSVAEVLRAWLKTRKPVIPA
jgi:predicted glycogen debranching enzyme